MQILLFLLPAVAFAAHPHHAPAHGYGHPKLYCRDTNTSVYAEVCVPQFAPTVTPETLAVKIVVPETFCYERVITTCVETNSVNTHTLCTSTYAAVEQKFPVGDPLAGHITQIGYDEKSETMKVTACRATGYGNHYGAGEHQHCQQEYQTQAYKVPTVDTDLIQALALSEPQPVETCVDVDVTITEVKCTDDISEKCIDLVNFADSTNTIDIENVAISEEPNCSQVTLTLPTQACSKPY
jgi:hypothetical protein